MSGPFGSSQWMYATGEQPFYPYTIDNSLRFDGSSYLRRLSATSSAIHQFTMSFWVKISDGGSSTSTPYHLMSFQATGSTATAGLCLYDNEITYFFNNSAYASFNPAKARDYSGWYHVVWKNKSDYYADIYINGVLIGTTSVQFEIINGSAISVGSGTSGNNPFAGGYIADVHFVSGQSLGPDSFGEYDRTGTIWKPKAFSGSHGTDGFHLDFADDTSATTLGYDVSGNSNNLTPSGIATSDQMLDSPTNNFATLNPLSEVTYATTSEGNLEVTAADRSHIVTTHAMESGQWYAEGVVTNTQTFAIWVMPSNSSGYVGAANGGPGVGYYSTGYIYGEVSPLSGYATYTTNDVIGAAVDMDAGTVKFYKNNTLIYTFNMSGSSNDWSRAYFGWNAGQTGSRTVIHNFGQDSSFAGTKTRQNNADENGYGDFYYTPPTGHLALCTQNLPAPTFDPEVGASPQDAFNVYTGTGANILSTAQSDYSDGLFWIKDRATAVTDHQLLNTVTGTVLESNTTDAERDYSNPSGSSVAWSWKGGGASAAFNIDGVGYATASAAGLDGGTQNPTGATVNTQAGVGIYTYTGDGTTKTIAHGLGVAPSVVIIKNRSTSANWFFYTDAVDGSMDFGYVNLTNAFSTSGRTLTSTTFDHNGSTDQGTNGDGYVAWVFAEKEGFSKFGSYEGNASADGTFVYLGFKPAWVMIKNASTASTNWAMFDNKRDGYNVDNDYFLTNTNDIENTTDVLDLVSNGFKLRNSSTSNGAYTYFYMAFAEQPFKYANAR